MAQLGATLKKGGSKALSAGSSAISKGSDLTTGLPPWAKGVIVVGLGFIAWKIYHGVTKGISQSQLNQKSRDSIQETQGWYKELEESKKSDKTKPTMSNAEMKSFANRLQTTMDGYGTRDYDIKQMFKRVKTNGDFAGINSAFGTRSIARPTGLIWVSDFRGTMAECLQEEADSDTLDAVNKTLKDNGISYRI